METPNIPGVEFRGYDCHTQRPAAAIVMRPVDAATKERVFKALPPDVKHNILLAKKWRAWAVYASERWAFQHRDTPPPNQRGARNAERGTGLQPLLPIPATKSVCSV